MKTTFDDAVCPTPTPGGNHQGLSGGYPIADVGPGGQGLVGTPYTEGICPPISGKETSSSELGTTPTLTDVKDAPAGQPSGMSSVELIEKHVNNNATFNTPK
jgi:hypothetical protein